MNNVCKVCCKRECQIENQSYKCDWCKVKCRNFACLEYHQLFKCGKQKKCEICNRFMYANHICNGRFCNNCKINVNIQHQCFILSEEERSIQNKRKNSIKNTTFYKGYIFSV
jgi:hypothetical protein